MATKYYDNDDDDDDDDDDVDDGEFGGFEVRWKEDQHITTKAARPGPRPEI